MLTQSNLGRVTDKPGSNRNERLLDRYEDLESRIQVNRESLAPSLFESVLANLVLDCYSPSCIEIRIHSFETN